MLHASCFMRKLIVTVSLLISIQLSAVAAEITVIDDFSDGFFEETLAPGEGLNQLQTGLSGVLGGERRFRAQDIRAIPGPGGTVTVGVLERDGGIAAVDSKVYVESLSLTYENVQLNLTERGFSALNVDLNLSSLRNDFPGPLALGFDILTPQDTRIDAGAVLTELGKHTISMNLDEFRIQGPFDASNVDRISLSVTTRSGVEVEIDRIYFVPEPVSVLNILLGVLPLISGMRHCA
ncbi:MAG: hypothetical protein KDB27_19640, partial [Planctomycetales bacterium]|nr:hypothetical protein [Planctomycetales bacterium]